MKKKKNDRPFLKFWGKTFLWIKGIAMGIVGVSYILKKSWMSITGFFTDLGAFVIGHPLVMYIMANILFSLMIAGGLWHGKKCHWAEDNPYVLLLIFGFVFEAMATLVYILYLIG